MPGGKAPHPHYDTSAPWPMSLWTGASDAAGTAAWGYSEARAMSDS